MKSDLDKIVKDFVVPPGNKVSLKKDYQSIIKSNFSKEELSEMLQEGVLSLANEQDKLSAQGRYGLLIVLQAMDAAGKDSTIKHVMSGVNPQGCHVYNFKAPSTEELRHDYLWRCARALPERGSITIFNRSYYEEVLITRVHPDILQSQQLPPELVGKSLWKQRFKEINNFEQYLVNNGIVVLKFFLYLSKGEQKKRFLARIDQPEKNWKMTADDVRDRERWNDYIDAYEDCLSNTSTESAPWHVIPADYKPYTRLVVAYIIQNTLKTMKLNYPEIDKEQREELQKARQILESEKG